MRRLRSVSLFLFALVLVGLVGLPGRADAAPTPETTLTGVLSVATGDQHTCAVLTNHQLRCWGDGSYGKLGNQQVNNPGSMTPVAVLAVVGPGNLTDVTQVALGFNHSCALLGSHQVRCWGYNNAGQLGHPTVSSSVSRPQVVRNPTDTGPLQGVVAIDAGGDTTCALLTNHQVRCWGANSYGAVGDGSATNRTLPVVVSNPLGTGPLTGVSQISVGGHHVCALVSGGQVRCWGFNTAGQVGDGTRTVRRRPQIVRSGSGGGPLTGVTQVSAGDTVTCARIQSRQVRCWGRNVEGGLGIGSPVPRSTRPVTVHDVDGSGPLTGIARVEAGQLGVCARTGSGGVRCWGGGEHGQVGNGTTGISNRLPVVVQDTAGTAPLTGLTQLAFTARHACVRTTAGWVQCWGYGLSGNLGDGDDVDRPLPVDVSA